jgi:hypothetical protein
MNATDPSKVFRQVFLHRLPVSQTGFAGPVFPCKNADSRYAVESDPGQGGEEVVPVDLALADVEVLMQPRGRTGRVDDVAQADDAVWSKEPARCMWVSRAPAYGGVALARRAYG